MVDENSTDGSSGPKPNRRSVLKGIAAAGLAGGVMTPTVNYITEPAEAGTTTKNFEHELQYSEGIIPEGEKKDNDNRWSNYGLDSGEDCDDTFLRFPEYFENQEGTNNIQKRETIVTLDAKYPLTDGVWEDLSEDAVNGPCEHTYDENDPYKVAVFWADLDSAYARAVVGPFTVHHGDTDLLEYGEVADSFILLDRGAPISALHVYHELGHTLGILHPPCGIMEADGDPTRNMDYMDNYFTLGYYEKQVARACPHISYSKGTSSLTVDAMYNRYQNGWIPYEEYKYYRDELEPNNAETIFLQETWADEFGVFRNRDDWDHISDDTSDSQWYQAGTYIACERSDDYTSTMPWHIREEGTGIAPWDEWDNKLTDFGSWDHDEGCGT